MKHRKVFWSVAVLMVGFVAGIITANGVAAVQTQPVPDVVTAAPNQYKVELVATWHRGYLPVVT